MFPLGNGFLINARNAGQSTVKHTHTGNGTCGTAWRQLLCSLLFTFNVYFFLLFTFVLTSLYIYLVLTSHLLLLLFAFTHGGYLILHFHVAHLHSRKLLVSNPMNVPAHLSFSRPVITLIHDHVTLFAVLVYVPLACLGLAFCLSLSVSIWTNYVKLCQNTTKSEPFNSAAPLFAYGIISFC